MTDPQMTGYAALSLEPMIAFCSYGKHYSTVRRLLYEDTSLTLFSDRR